MARHVLRPTSTSVSTNLAYGGAPTAHEAIDDTVLDALDWAGSGNSTGLTDCRFGMSNTPASFSGIVVNSVKLVIADFQTPNTPQSATWDRTFFGYVRTGGVDYDGTSVSKDDSAAYGYTYEYTWTVNPGTGVRWTQSDLDAIECGYEESARNGASTQYLHFSQLYLIVDYVPLAGEADRVRDILSRDLVIRRRGRRLLEADAPIEFADLQVGDLLRVAQAPKLAPNASNLGWPITAPRLFRVLQSSIDLGRMQTHLQLQDLRANVDMFTHFEINYTNTTPGIGGQGIVRAGLGGTRTHTRATLAWVDDTGTARAGGHKVTEIPSGYDAWDENGWLCEASCLNRCGRSSFLDGLTGWTTVAGTVTAETTAAYQLFDSSVTLNPATQSIQHMKLVVAAGVTPQAYTDSTATLSGNYTVSVDHVPVTADATYLRVQRTSDSKFWDGAAWQVAATDHSMGTTAGRYQLYVNMDVLTTMRVHVLGSTTTNGDEWRIQHVQIENRKFATSRVVTSGGGTYTRNKTQLTIAQTTSPDTVLMPNTGFTAFFWVVPEWSLADITADRYVFACDYDANNHIRLLYDQTNSRWLFQMKVAGTTKQSVVSSSPVKSTLYKLVCRFTSSSGDHGYSAYQPHLFLDGTIGSTPTAHSAGPTEAAVSFHLGETDAAASQLDGWIRRWGVTPFVLSDQEVERFQ